MKPKEPDFEAIVRNSFNKQKFMDHLGARLILVEPGYCEIEADYREELSQHHGFIHAGVMATIADNAAGYAAYTLVEKGYSILATEYKINFLSPGHGEKLLACGKVIKMGRKLTVCGADVYVFNKGKKKLCATSLSTMIAVETALRD